MLYLLLIKILFYLKVKLLILFFKTLFLKYKIANRYLLFNLELVYSK